MPPQVDAVVFDLDGTLWDTCEACAQGWNNVIARHGMNFREITAADIRGVVGHALGEDDAYAIGRGFGTRMRAE